MSWETRIAYLAGVFDGEGTIGVIPSMGKLGYVHFLDIQVVNKDYRLLALLQATFGGSIWFNESAKATHSWKATSKDAVKSLLLMRPYLLSKATQADLAIDFEVLKQATKYREDGVDHWRQEGVPLEIQAQRHAYVEAIRRARNPWRSSSGALSEEDDGQEHERDEAYGRQEREPPGPPGGSERYRETADEGGHEELPDDPDRGRLHERVELHENSHGHPDLRDRQVAEMEE